MAHDPEKTQRLILRAMLYLAKDTMVSSTEVALALSRDEDWVRSNRPETAARIGPGRAILAPFGDWIEALGYGKAEPREPVLEEQEAEVDQADHPLERPPRLPARTFRGRARREE